MSGTMTHPHRHHNVYWYFLVAMLVAVIVIVGILVFPYFSVPKTAIIPVTGNQNAYAEYLLGEKTIYAMSANDAMAAYHLDERSLYTRTINSSEALSNHLFGEKHVMTALDYALLTYRSGEKDY